MISFLTAIVVMVAIGTVIQRASIFGGDDAEPVVVALVDDELTVPANTLYKLDIFANDTGISEEEKQSLTILSEPKCGRLLAGRGVLQYFGGDTCAGPQTIVYTLSAMAEPMAATVTAFVVSDARPDVRPEKSPGVEKEEPDSTLGDSAEVIPFGADDATDDDSETRRDDTPLPELTVGGTPAIAATKETPELILDVEPDAARSLPGRTPDAPAVGDSATAGLALSDTTDGKGTPNGIPEKPATPNTPATRNAGRISLALVPRGNTLNGPRPVEDVVLDTPSDGRDRPLARGASPDADLAARSTPGDLLPDSDAPRIGSVSPAKTIPLPVKRSAKIAALSTTTEARGDKSVLAGDADPAVADREGVAAERRIAALKRAEADLGRVDGSEAQAPLGTDLTPKVLTGEKTNDARDLPRLTALSEPGVTPAPAGKPLELTTPSDDRPAVPKLSARNRRPVGVVGADAPRAPGDDAAPKVAFDRADAALSRDRIAKPDRVAALTQDQKRTPRADLMRKSLEPDNIQAGREAAALGLTMSVEEQPQLDAAPNPAPEAKRSAAVVQNDAASSYSFFTPVPRRDARDGDERIVGASRAAGAVVPDLTDDMPNTVENSDEVIAAILPTSRTEGLPKLDLALPRAPVEPGQGPGDNTRPEADPNCTTPPSAELEVKRAARTIVRIVAPCQAESVAELIYSGLRLAIPLDRKGQGKVLALGFEANSAAIVKFTDDKELNFDLPFRGVGQIERIAVIWDIPVSLELHALEFGAKTGDQNHINPANPRTFGEVRRSGGGFLHAYRSYAGIGQNAQIYTHWKRRGGEGGIVKLMIDYASRNRDRLDGTCGAGSYSAPGFFVLRSSSGRLTKSASRQLASLSCSRVSEEIGDKRLISGAIRDLVVTN